MGHVLVTLTLKTFIIIWMENLIVLVCHADNQRKALIDEIGEFGAGLQTMVRAAGGRYFGMSNKLSEADTQRQTQDLIDMMKVTC